MSVYMNELRRLDYPNDLRMAVEPRGLPHLSRDEKCAFSVSRR